MQKCLYCDRSVNIDLNDLSNFHENCISLYENDLVEESSAINQLGEILEPFEILSADPDYDGNDPIPTNYVVLNNETLLVTIIVLDGRHFTDDEDTVSIPHCNVIPSLLAKFNRVEEIAFNFCGNLGVWNTDFSHLTHLERLGISESFVTCGRKLIFPKNLEDFYYSYYVDFAFPCQLISKLPVNLENLTIEFPYLNHIPLSITRLRNLKTLKLESSIDFIPEFFFSLENLQTLDLSHNKLSKLTPYWYKLENLQELLLNYNKIKSISALSGIKNLQKLDVSNNLICDISDLHELPVLENFSISNNKIVDITHLSEFLRLKVISVADNELSTLPNSLNSLTELTTIFADGNLLSSIPTFPHAKIQQLSLNVDHHSSILDTISTFVDLTFLQISNSNPVKIPLTFKKLTKLQRLDLYMPQNCIPQFLKDLESIHMIYCYEKISNSLEIIKLFYLAPEIPSPFARSESSHY